MDRYALIEADLRERPRRWLLTGAAGFIGSHLLERLLSLGQTVTALDDFSTGKRSNVDAAIAAAGDRGLTFLEGDIRDPDTCTRAMAGVELVVHQAALGSVPRSIDNPRATHEVNVDGFLNIALAAVQAQVAGFVYASSSSVYGDSDRLPKREGEEGRPLSPYAASKRTNEVFAQACVASYRLPAVGLRYFNVVGPRQDPHGAYAAVVPRWLKALSVGEGVAIFGDGLTSRDFCPVENVVRANLLSAFAPEAAWGRAFNVGLGGRTTLNDLYNILRDGLAARGAPCAGLEPRYEPFRKGDARHSLADISGAVELLGYAPAVSLADGLGRAIDHAWPGVR
jgi:UDP-N-acetylglucosamine/UDP-N-acetylgalactosamine 4-epimerase